MLGFRHSALTKQHVSPRHISQYIGARYFEGLSKHCLMGDLAGRLKGLQLDEYLDILCQEGFETWDTIVEITESDL
jgi:hypothetical protein